MKLKAPRGQWVNVALWVVLIWLTWPHCNIAFNSLWPWRFQWNFRWVLFKPITVIDTCCEIALRRMSLDLTDDKSTLVQVMAWCRQATSHYLSQCWPRFMSRYGVTRPQCVKKYLTFKTRQRWALHLLCEPYWGCAATFHDDVIKWKLFQLFPRYWPFVRGVHRSRWIPHTRASDAELWCFLWSASE